MDFAVEYVLPGWLTVNHACTVKIIETWKLNIILVPREDYKINIYWFCRWSKNKLRRITYEIGDV